MLIILWQRMQSNTPQLIQNDVMVLTTIFTNKLLNVFIFTFSQVLVVTIEYYSHHLIFTEKLEMPTYLHIFSQAKIKCNLSNLIQVDRLLSW